MTRSAEIFKRIGKLRRSGIHTAVWMDKAFVFGGKGADERCGARCVTDGPDHYPCVVPQIDPCGQDRIATHTTLDAAPPALIEAFRFGFARRTSVVPAL